ncbi:MAG: hypothetical protein Q7S03_00475 [bacterium]|nr:hypothetical protein [bacterium]
MRYDVNFLPAEELSKEESRLQKKTRVSFLVFIIIYVFLAGGLFTTFFYYSRQQQDLKNQGQKLESQIKELWRKEGLAVTLKMQMDVVDQVIKQKELANLKGVGVKQLLDWTAGFMEKGIVITDIGITEKNITFSGEAPDANVISEFSGQLGDDKRFSLISLESLTRTLKGKYTFSLKAVFL